MRIVRRVKEEHHNCSTVKKNQNTTIDKEETFMNNTSTLSYQLCFYFHNFTGSLLQSLSCSAPTI